MEGEPGGVGSRWSVSEPWLAWLWWSPEFLCLTTLGEAKGESGGTGEGDSEGRPSELRELPLGWRRRLLEIETSLTRGWRLERVFYRHTNRLDQI